jgi:thymidylate synthase (FAD)
MENYPILDAGYIKLLDVFGTELTIVNAARTSFGVSKQVLDEKDISLMKYLVKNKHFSPFRHCLFRFEIKAPEFVLRQLFRHIIGIEVTSTYPTQLHAWSERSGRYKLVDEFHTPKVWRKQSDTAKQGSDGLLDSQNQEIASAVFTETMNHINDTYQKLISMGVAKEQARVILPLNQYNTVIWTGSLQALLFLIEQRTDSHAQQEIQEYASVFDQIVQKHFPNIYTIVKNEK